MLKHQLFDGWRVLIDNFILIIQKLWGKSEELMWKCYKMTPSVIGALSWNWEERIQVAAILNTWAAPKKVLSYSGSQLLQFRKPRHLDRKARDTWLDKPTEHIWF